MKINRFITIMAAVLVLLNAAACKSQEASSRASGNRVESVSLPSFDAIENDAAVNIHFTQGDRQSVRVRHAEGWRLKLSVSGKTLKMEVADPDSRRGQNAGAGADVWITLPYLKTVSNDGALHLDAASIKEDRLGIYNNGAMTVDVDKMNIGTFKCANSGSLRYSTKLKANKMSIDNNGALTDTLSASCPDINISNNGALTTSLAVADPQRLRRGKQQREVFLETRKRRNHNDPHHLRQQSQLCLYAADHGRSPLSRIGNNHRPHHEKGPRPAVRPATAEEP